MTKHKTEQPPGTHAGGRQTKLTPQTTKALTEALRAGNYIETACAYANISTTAYFRWIQEADTGTYEKSGTKIDTQGVADRIEFREAVARARAEAEVRNVALIQQAGADPKNWSAAAWWLERSHPTRWGRQTKVVQEISGPAGAPIQITDPRGLLTRLLAGGEIDPAELPAADSVGDDDDDE